MDGLLQFKLPLKQVQQGSNIRFSPWFTLSARRRTDSREAKSGTGKFTRESMAWVHVRERGVGERGQWEQKGRERMKIFGGLTKKQNGKLAE